MFAQDGIAVGAAMGHIVGAGLVEIEGRSKGGIHAGTLRKFLIIKGSARTPGAGIHLVQHAEIGLLRIDYFGQGVVILGLVQATRAIDVIRHHGDDRFLARNQRQQGQRKDNPFFHINIQLLFQR